MVQCPTGFLYVWLLGLSLDTGQDPDEEEDMTRILILLVLLTAVFLVKDIRSHVSQVVVGNYGWVLPVANGCGPLSWYSSEDRAFSIPEMIQTPITALYIH